MNAIVVYESLWGNTAEVAHAIAKGLGDGVRVLTTSQASPDDVAAADLVVAGAPIHMGRLPSEKTRVRARERFEDQEKWPGLPEPNLTEPSLTEWLSGLPRRRGGHGAAFDTRSPGRWAGDAAGRISSELRRRGYRRIVRPAGFVVESQSGPLAEGERERAVAWGREIGRAAADLPQFLQVRQP